MWSINLPVFAHGKWNSKTRYYLVCGCSFQELGLPQKHHEVPTLCFIACSATTCFCLGANIFLTSSGLIKLGDFGCSVKLKNNTQTMPGEVNSTLGTAGKDCSTWPLGLAWGSLLPSQDIWWLTVVDGNCAGLSNHSYSNYSLLLTIVRLSFLFQWDYSSLQILTFRVAF